VTYKFRNEWNSTRSFVIRLFLLEFRPHSPIIRGGLTICRLTLIAYLLSTTSAWAASSKDIEQTFENRVLVRSASLADWYVTKWEKDIRVGIVSEEGVTPTLVQNIMSATSEFEKLTGKQVLITTADTNFMIFISKNINIDLDHYKDVTRRFFTTESEYNKFIQGFRSSGSFCAQKLVNSESIKGYFMIVSVIEEEGIHKIDEVTLKCIISGILRGVGIEGTDVTSGAFFYFNYQGTSFSEIDKELLKILYNPSIKSGSKRDTVMEKVRQIVHESNK
jgi:hypothetical protein